MNRLSIHVSTRAGCCGDSAPIADERYGEADSLFQVLDANIRAQPEFEVIVDIDYSGLTGQAGSPMPPSHGLIWSYPELRAAILKLNPLAVVDLPLRVLAFEDAQTGQAAVIANRYDYLAGRYSLPDDEAIRAAYQSATAEAMNGIPGAAITEFASDTVSDGGLVTLDSPDDFACTENRILEAIGSEADTVSLGSVDFTARAKAQGLYPQPLRLILFGVPGPGG